MSIRNASALVLGAGLVTLTTGCPLLEISIEAEVKDVCMTYEDLEVPGSDGSGALSHRVVFDDLQDVDGLDELDGNVEFVSVVLRAKSGVSDFSFLDAAHVTVASADPASDLPEATIVDCSGDGCARDGAELTIFASESVDALAYLRSDAIAIGLDVAGELPETAWVVDIDVCVKGKVRITAGL